MIAARVQEYLKEKAKKRQLAGIGPDGSGGRGKKKNLSPNLGEGLEQGKSADEAARLLNVARGTVESAAKVLKDGAPELIASVDAGETSVSRAAKVAIEAPCRRRRFHLRWTSPRASHGHHAGSGLNT
jgi:hypothetical protein